MKRKFLLLALILSSWLVFPVEIMKLADVKVGMEGEGRTIFKGSQIETFTCRVLGVIENFSPGKNLIIMELDAAALKDGGVIAGMSGSPVYITGKLVGSVSYGFSFSKKPIAGITPIEDIIKVSDHNAPAYEIDISNIKVEFSRESNRRVGEFIQSELKKRAGFSPLANFEPIKLVASGRGINPEMMASFMPVLTPGLGLNQKLTIEAKKAGESLFTVSPADAVSIPLVRGDFEYSYTGTVTHVDGNKVYVFGHPLFNLGRIDFPLHRADVVAVVPSYETSFKLVASRNPIGTVLQDRFSGVQGELGKTPTMIPLKVFLKNRNKTYNLEIINHPMLSPALTYVSLMSIFTAEYQQYGFQSLTVNGKIFVENEDNVVINDLYSGANAFDDFSNLMMAINFFLLNNKERNVRIQKIDLEISNLEKIKRADLENVLVEKNLYLPGEAINVSLYLKNEQGENFQERLTIKVPNLQPGSSFYLLAADATEMMDFDAKVIKTGFFPGRLSALIRAINNLRRNNRVYFKLFIPSQGLFIKGYEYPHLPSSLNNVLAYNAASRDQSSLMVSTITEYQYELPAVVSGKKIIKIKIKARKDEP